jgi:antitoxin VapB
VAFSIKNPEADRLARELAAATGETLTEAVLKALEERLRREEGRMRRSLADELDEIAKRCSALPVLDDRSPDEIIGYNELGVPE